MVAVLYFTSLDVWLTVLVVNPPPPPLSIPHLFFVSDLDSLSLTRELKIKVVGFVLKKLFTRFKMLIVSHV